MSQDQTITKKNNARAVKVHNAITLDAAMPVSVPTDSHALISLGGHSYLPFFAPDDELFKELLTYRFLSPTQGACIGDKTLYSIGEGLQVQDQEFPKDFDRKINSRRQTIDAVLRMVFDGYWQDGNKFIEVCRYEVAGKRYVQVFEHANIDCRLEMPEDGDEPTHVLRSREFRKHGILHHDKVVEAVRIPLWTDMPMPDQEVWLKDEKGVERTMFHIKNPVSGLDGYGLPTNFAGMNLVRLEYKGIRFNLDNFENNMFLGGILMISGSINPTEEKKLTKNIRNMYIGEGKQNRILPISSEQGITDTKFVPFSEKHEGHFIELDKRNEEKIIGTNNWSKELMDLKNQSGLGKGGDFLVKLFKGKYQTIIKPAQTIVMEDFVFPLMQIIDEWKGTRFYELPWYIKPSIPVAFEGALDINALLTVDEGREEIGRKPFNDERGKKSIAEVSKGSQIQLPFEKGGDA